METRKLATIEKITNIRHIDNADNIEQCSIRGWNVIIKKNEFKEGDLCVYCEIDSVMPKKSEFEFLSQRKYRIKTIKLKNIVSQGIAFPLSILPEEYLYQKQNGDISLGSDVTEALGITKYEEPIPACLGGQVKGEFPSHSIKTDEERIQNLINYYDYYRTRYIWVATEKLDGSSTTYSIFNDEFEVSSRNKKLKETEENSFWKIAREKDVENKMRKFMSDHELLSLTIQGELIGEGIQGNKYNLKGQTIRFFRVFDPVSYNFFEIHDAINAIKEMGLEFVPIVEDNLILPKTVEELLNYADGISAMFNTLREGVVFVAYAMLPTVQPDNDYNVRKTRPLTDYNNRLSFKAISNKFIIKHNL